ncbi:MAG: glycosyltransferase family 2 protein [Chloroflexi bacterium]|nr:glycosyltransferase family 2 protein [Chloroflexota bacterium]
MLYLSVIIVSYNTEMLLANCLRSVLASLASSGISDCEIIVVDNASSDGSDRLVRTQFPQVRLIGNERNVGFAAAANQGIRQSQGRYALLLNPDTLVLGKAIGEMAAFLDQHPKAGVVNCKLLHGDGSFQHSAFRFPTLLMSFFDFFPLHHRLANSRLNGRYPVGAYLAPFQIDHPLGACFMVRREALDEVGLLDEGFFMYCEEVDWCLRIKKQGWLIHCQPEAEVVHYTGQSTRQSWGPMYVELHRSRFRLFRKHYSPLFCAAARRIVRLGIWREIRKARSLRGKGLITEAEFQQRQQAYGEILKLISEDAYNLRHSHR